MISRIDGVTLNENEWLDVAVVAIRNMDNAGRFSQFSDNLSDSQKNTGFYVSYYINGQYVGTANGKSYYEWKNNSSTRRTSANQVLTIKSFTIDGEPLYLANGSVAREVTYSVLTTQMKNYYGKINNFRSRALSMRGHCYADIDLMRFSIKNSEDAVYGTLAESATANTASSFDLTLPTLGDFGHRSELFELATFNKGEASSPMLLADPVSGALVIGSEGKYYALCNKDGELLKLSENSTTPATVVYDDINGTARYFVKCSAAYIAGAEAVVPAVSVPVFNDKLCLGGENDVECRVYLGLSSEKNLADVDDYNAELLNIKDSDTAEIIGFRSNTLSGGIRIVAGVDLLYYENIGFETEIYESGELVNKETAMNGIVFESIIGDGMDITPSKYGYSYFATLNIHSLPENIPENSYILARSFVDVGGVKKYDGYVKINVTNEGYSFEDYIKGNVTNLKEAEESLKTLGRAYYLDNAIALDHAAAGFAFNYNGNGDIALNVTTEKDARISITFDGVTTDNFIIPAGTNNSNVIIAEDVADGNHSVSIVSESGVAVPFTVNSIVIDGVLTDAPKNKETYIEFIGDSITAGYGLYAATDEEDHHDATLSYAYRTVEKLDADYAIFARSGMGIAYAGGGENIFENRYKYESCVRNTTDLYQPERTPDLVVINLAQNDNYQWYSKGGNNTDGAYNYTDFDAKFGGMIDTVTGLYRKDIPILFVYGCMESTSFTPLATVRSKELIDTVYTEENGYDVSYVVLTTNRGDSHFDSPSLRVFGYRYFELFYEALTGRECTYDYSQDPDFYRITPEEEPDDGSDGFDITAEGYISYLDFDDMEITSYTANNNFDNGLIVRASKTNPLEVVKKGTSVYAAINGNGSSETSYIDVPGVATVGSKVVVELDLLVGEDIAFTGNAPLLKLLDSSGSMHLIGLNGSANDDGTGFYFYDPTSGEKICDISDYREWLTIKIVCDMTSGDKTVYIKENGVEKQYDLKLPTNSSTYEIRSMRVAQLSKNASGTIYVDNYKFYYAE